VSQSGRSDDKRVKDTDLTEELPVVRDCVSFRLVPVSHDNLLCNVLFRVSIHAIVTNVASLNTNDVHHFESVETA
jgi:hypothetical protein